MSMWVENRMSSSYVINFIQLFGGVGMSDVYVLNSVGENTPRYVTPVFIVACFDIVLYIVLTFCIYECSLVQILCRY